MSMDGPAAPTRPVEQRVGELMGDRVCAKCAFNLHGQVIVREPHYGLIMVRCPECGTAAALQEYPAVGRWGQRGKFLFAAVYLLGMLALLAITIGIVAGFTEEAISLTTSRYTSTASLEYQQFVQSTQGPAQTNTWVTGSPGQPVKWWESLPPEKYLADKGGFWGVMHWWGLLIWVWAGLVLTPAGMVWSVLLPRSKAVTRLVVAGMILFLAGLIFAPEFITPSTSWRGGTWSWWSVEPNARAQIGWPIALASLMVCAGFACVGMWLGRSVARWLVRLLLPRGMQAAFRFLWTEDGRAF